MTADPLRLAIYFAPAPDSPLAVFGAACLGRDAETANGVRQFQVDGVAPERWAALTQTPRTYGFHATLKAPFRLKAGRTREELVQEVERLAGRLHPFEAPALSVGRIADFVALTLPEPSAPLDALAAACVRELDDFRAPPTDEEMMRRRPDRLSPAQRALLITWGYPYVLEEWRFHMTLATGLAGDEAEHVRTALEKIAAPVCQAPLAVDAIALFEQQAREAPLLMTRRFPLGGAAAR